MAVSLVSTGVQFPDSTIQTTAAAGNSVFTTGSLILTGTYGNFGGGGVYVLKNPSTIGETLILTGQPPQDITFTTGISQNRGSDRDPAYNAKYDFYRSQLIVTTRATADYGSSNQTIRTVSRAKYGGDWTSITAGSNISYDTAVNYYTGQNVIIRTQQSNGSIYTNGPTNLYNLSGATNTTSGTAVTGGTTTMYFINFLDLGSQGASKFFIGCFNSDASQYRILSSTDGITWTNTLGYSGSRTWGAANFAGNATEIMCGHAGGSSYGVLRSTDSGASWDNYNFGDSTHGTGASQYPKSLAHNGTYWLSVSSNSNYLVSKAMGSGTTWTYISGFPTTFGSPSSVTYNSSDSKWYVLVANSGYAYLYTNTASDPSTGSWTLVQTPLQLSNAGIAGGVSNIMALSSQALNPYMWTTLN